MCTHSNTDRQTDRQTDVAEVTEEVRREGPSDASRWSDGGREERRGEAGTRTKRPNAYRLFLRR